MPWTSDEQLERDRQREADRLASEANPPKPALTVAEGYDGSQCKVEWTAYGRFDYCPLGVRGCTLKHDGSDPIPAEALEARQAANKAARKRDGEHRQD